jgi:hypothetical protein
MPIIWGTVMAHLQRHSCLPSDRTRFLDDHSEIARNTSMSRHSNIRTGRGRIRVGWIQASRLKAAAQIVGEEWWCWGSTCRSRQWMTSVWEDTDRVVWKSPTFWQVWNHTFEKFRWGTASIVTFAHVKTTLCWIRSDSRRNRLSDSLFER